MRELKALQPISDAALERLSSRMRTAERLLSSVLFSSADNKSVVKLTQEQIEAAKERKFKMFRHLQIKQIESEGRSPWGSDVKFLILKEELDLRLQQKLRIAPESRYQHTKKYLDYHPSSFLKRGLDRFDGEGCAALRGGCIPECPYYPETGRVEGEQVIKDHEEILDFYRKEGTLIE